MDEIVFKNKNLKVLEKLDENSFKVEYKKRICVVKVFDENSYENFKNSAKTLKIAGISTPKVLKFDNKNFRVLLEFIDDSKTCLDALISGPLSDEYFKEIFKIAWYARFEKIKLDYHPDNFVLKDGVMYYMPFTFERGYEESDAFQTVGLRYWFYTRETTNYLTSKGYQIDKSRVKDEYQINKDMVLCVCKFHH